MRDYELRLKRIFDMINSAEYFSENDIQKTINEPFNNWDTLWTLISLGRIKVNLLSQKPRFKSMDEIMN